MHPHQHEYLVAELRKPEYDGMSCDEAAVAMHHPMPNDDPLPTERVRPPKSFLAVSFVCEDKFKGSDGVVRRPKSLPATAVLVSGEYAATFPTGIPGMPNLVRREDFDAAWNAR